MENMFWGLINLWKLSIQVNIYNFRVLREVIFSIYFGYVGRIGFQANPIFQLGKFRYKERKFP